MAQPTKESNEAGEERPKTLPSSAEGRLRQLRRKLVLQLYTRRGPLWQAVRDLRERWNISAKVQLPPDRARLLPEDAPGSDDDGYQEYVMRWFYELDVIRTKVDPNRYLTLHDFLGNGRTEAWFEFLEACVLYDPPIDQLMEFASRGSQEPTFLDDGRVTGESLQELPEMVDPPIKSLWELMQMGGWFLERILDHISERYLEAHGMDKETLLQAILLEFPSLLEEYEEKRRRYSTHYYIEVDEQTTKDDVHSAFRLIRALQEGRPKGRPKRDPLIAVQCALLHDQCGWTYRQQMQRYGFGSVDTAEAHVEKGKEILEEY